MNYLIRDIDINLWAEVKHKATLERKSMKEAIFEGLRLYALNGNEPAASKGKKAKKKGD